MSAKVDGETAEVLVRALIHNRSTPLMQTLRQLPSHRRLVEAMKDQQIVLVAVKPSAPDASDK